MRRVSPVTGLQTLPGKVMVIICTVVAIILFLCGLMKAMSGYGPGTGFACMFLAIFMGLYLYTPYVDGVVEML